MGNKEIKKKVLDIVKKDWSCMMRFMEKDVNSRWKLCMIWKECVCILEKNRNRFIIKIEDWNYNNKIKPEMKFKLMWIKK